jgi:hypothetical protein
MLVLYAPKPRASLPIFRRVIALGPAQEASSSGWPFSFPTSFYTFRPPRRSPAHAAGWVFSEKRGSRLCQRNAGLPRLLLVGPVCARCAQCAHSGPGGLVQRRVTGRRGFCAGFCANRSHPPSRLVTSFAHILNHAPPRGRLLGAQAPARAGVAPRVQCAQIARDHVRTAAACAEWGRDPRHPPTHTPDRPEFRNAS